MKEEIALWLKTKKKYTSILAKVETDVGSTIDRWFILEDGIPFFVANEWLERKTFSTAKKYAHNLSRYLNFLEMRNVTYKDAKRKDVILFIDYLIFGITDKLVYINKDGLITFSTLSGYITTITEFYRNLEDDLNETGEENIRLKKKKMYNSNQLYLYGQIWGSEYLEIIERRLKRLKPSRKYIKWYSEREVEALKANFKTLRDKAVFLCCFDGGLRIDEALSVKLQDYDSEEMTVKPYRSKGKNDGMGRVVAISEETCDVINKYIWNERSVAETGSGKFSDLLFINLRRGEAQGEPLEYKNYLPILKSCASRAGLDPDKIRTHSGRSSKTMQLLEFQASHPEENVTDEMIRQIMGWSSDQSIESYKNIHDVRLAKITAHKFQKRKS